MSSQREVHNPHATEVIYTSDGRILPGNTTGTAPTDDPQTARLIDSGRLLLCERSETTEAQDTEEASVTPKTVRKSRRKTTGLEPVKDDSATTRITQDSTTTDQDTGGAGEPQEPSTETTKKESN